MNYIDFIELEPAKESPKLDKTVMFCECCEKPFKRWYIDIVEPEDCVFEVNQLMRDHGKEAPEFNFACAQCCTELCLQPIQTEHTKKFRRVNEKLRQEFEPTVIN